MNIKVYAKDTDGFYLDKTYDEDPVLSVTTSNGNYVIILENEDYFGKLVYLYDVKRFKIEISNIK